MCMCVWGSWADTRQVCIDAPTAWRFAAECAAGYEYIHSLGYMVSQADGGGGGGYMGKRSGDEVHPLRRINGEAGWGGWVGGLRGVCMGSGR